MNPPSQVVAGVRTVTTNMDGRDVLPRLSRPFAFSVGFIQSRFNDNNFRQHARMQISWTAIIEHKMPPASWVIDSTEEFGIAAASSSHKRATA